MPKFKGLDGIKGLSKDVRTIREQLIMARANLKTAEYQRDCLVKAKHKEGWDMDMLMYQFGMTEANIIKAIDTKEY